MALCIQQQRQRGILQKVTLTIRLQFYVFQLGGVEQGFPQCVELAARAKLLHFEVDYTQVGLLEGDRERKSCVMDYRDVGLITRGAFVSIIAAVVCSY